LLDYKEWDDKRERRVKIFDKRVKNQNVEARISCEYNFESGKNEIFCNAWRHSVTSSVMEGRMIFVGGRDDKFIRNVTENLAHCIKEDKYYANSKVMGEMINEAVRLNRKGINLENRKTLYNEAKPKAMECLEYDSVKIGKESDLRKKYKLVEGSAEIMDMKENNNLYYRWEVEDGKKKRYWSLQEYEGGIKYEWIIKESFSKKDAELFIKQWEKMLNEKVPMKKAEKSKKAGRK